MEVGERPRHPLVHFCEHEVVDSRTLAAEISRALALQQAAQEGPVFWGQSPAMADLRRQLGVLALTRLLASKIALPAEDEAVAALGRALVAGLVHQIEGSAGGAEELLFEPELVVRGSTGPAPRGA